MSEVSLRTALTMGIIAAVAGVAALALGAFVAPIPTQQTDATQVVTAVFVRGLLALLALVGAIALAYVAGFRIERALGPAPTQPSRVAEGSPLLSLFTTPGPRRDAVYSGAITLLVYWLISTLYIVALGKVVGGVGVTASTLGSFLSSRAAQGLVLVAAGAGAGGLGARNAAMRRLTRRIFQPVAQVATQVATQASAPQVSAPQATQPVTPLMSPASEAPETSGDITSETPALAATDETQASGGDADSAASDSAEPSPDR